MVQKKAQKQNVLNLLFKFSSDFLLSNLKSSELR